MNGDSIDSSRSRSPGSHGGPAKRQKLDASVSSSLNTSSNDSILRSDRESLQLRELSVLRKRLSHTEAAAVQHRQIRNQIEELCEKEKNILEMQVQMDRETIDQLQQDLETARRTAQEAREAQAAAEAKLFRVQTTMEKQIKALLIENAKLKEGSHSNSRTSSKKETNSEEETPVTDNEASISQEDLNPQDIEVKDVRVVVQRCEPEIPTSEGQETPKTKEKRAKKSRKTSSPQRKSSQRKRGHKKRTSATKKKAAEPVAEEEEQADKTFAKPTKSRSRTSSDAQPEIVPAQNTENLETQADVLQIESDPFQRRSQRVKKRVNSKEPDVSQDDPLDQSDQEDAESEASKEYDPYPDSSYVNDPLALVSDDNDQNDNEASVSAASDDESSTHSNHEEDSASEDNQSQVNSTESKDEEPSIEKQPNDLRIRVGKHCFVLPSDPKFHELEWSEEFSLSKTGEWECKKCSVLIKKKRQRMEDHVWTTHYGGKFTCLHCNPFHPLFTSRESIFNHMDRKHPDLVTGKDESTAEVTG